MRAPSRWSLAPGALRRAGECGQDSVHYHARQRHTRESSFCSSQSRAVRQTGVQPWHLTRDVLFPTLWPGPRSHARMGPGQLSCAKGRMGPSNAGGRPLGATPENQPRRQTKRYRLPGALAAHLPNPTPAAISRMHKGVMTGSLANTKGTCAVCASLHCFQLQLSSSNSYSKQADGLRPFQAKLGGTGWNARGSSAA